MREIPIKYNQNGKGVKVYFLLPLTTEAFLFLLEMYTDVV